MGEVNSKSTAQLERRAVVSELLKDRGDLLLVTGLGSPSYDAMAAGDNPANFYLWGAMGSSVTIGLGLALAQPDRPVMVLTGDGELLMGLGALATAGAKQPGNLSIAVLDNERYGETGMQLTHSAQGVDLAGVAAACNFSHTEVIRDLNDVAPFGQRAQATDFGVRLAQIKIKAESPEKVLPSRDGVFITTRFRANLGFATL
ncbi:MAG: aldehyde dehydrogenase [Rhodospirillaceae bacterium]|jgi:thiamine pyrophosphate-dependent acetolactate synthase large subunit-like protein|nr:aldehyde dehydrogenase [Rhodospirillaceae bacterium]MBT7267521.1 aldehyde dehydrogenase [Rhodospirillaceae bacterium]